jgi:hypothetical protein
MWMAGLVRSITDRSGPQGPLFFGCFGNVANDFLRSYGKKTLLCSTALLMDEAMALHNAQ